MTLPATDVLSLVARVLLVGMFPFSAAHKLLFRQEALAQARSCVLPGGGWLLVAGGLLEITAPVGVVAGWHAGAAATLLAAYCIATALLFHAFWTQGDFWRPTDSTARPHFWDFLKNLGLAGGLLLVPLMMPF